MPFVVRHPSRTREGAQADGQDQESHQTPHARAIARIAAVYCSLLAPGTTISATIANEFTEAVGDIYTSALIELGLILFLITFVVLAIARYMLMRLERMSA